MIEKAICLWFLFLYGFFFLFFIGFFIYFIFCLFWKNSKPIRSCVLGSTSHRNLRVLPSRSALGCASGTTLGQRAQVSMLGRTSDAASNFSRGQSLIYASVDRGFLFQVVTSLLFSTRGVFSLVPSYEGTNSSIVPSYEGTNSSIVPSYEGAAGGFYRLHWRACAEAIAVRH